MHTIQLLIELKFGSITSPIFKITFRQNPNCLTELYFHIAQKSRFSDSPINYRCPPIAVDSTMIQVADFLCLCCRLPVPPRKSRFFVICFRYETLAGVIGHSPTHIEIRRFICYNNPGKRGCFYGENLIPLPRQDFPEFRKVLVPLRKFAFQNDFYQ